MAKRARTIAASPVPSRATAVGTFGLAIFLGAFLLFQVQPLIAKYILPWFGGSPAVWTTCMLFFQALLLGGYAYAHLSGRYLGSRAQVIVHGVLLVAALALLPIAPSQALKPGPAGNPTLQVLLLLAASVGLPYLALSATSPLLQLWFGRANPGVSPYRLYALSNLGSLLALLTYPFVFEPILSRRGQALAWSAGLVAFVAACAACGLAVWKRARLASTEPAAPPRPADPKSQKAARDQETASRKVVTRLLWIVLPACASSLLLAATNTICLDVAVVPFLWILPLAAYLVSFIVCFDHPRWYRREVFVPAAAAGLGLAYWVISQRLHMAIGRQVAGLVLVLFVCCMVCHGEVYRLRPDPRKLTGFYLAIALGGVLGGGFVALVAPLVFSSYQELNYSLMACVALAFLAPAADPTSWLGSLRKRRVAAIAAAAALVVVGSVAFYRLGRWENDRRGRVVSATRNFYGVLTVYEAMDTRMQEMILKLDNNGIRHGTEFTSESLRRAATTYYGPKSGIGVLMQAERTKPRRRIGVVGLGVGTLAAYGSKGDYFRFYELNPEVARIAREDFRFLADSPARTDIVLGDARLSMEREEDQAFDILVLDAFSGDAIPVHLLTREAFATWRRHLAPGGVIAVHSTNLSLDLGPVVERVAREAGLHTAYIGSNDDSPGCWPSDWILATTDAGLLARPEIRAATSSLGTRNVRLWTDDYTSLFPLLK